MSKQEAMKTCTKCGETKPLSSFQPRGGKKTGTYFAQCKKCDGARRLEWIRNNPEKERAQQQRKIEKLRQDPVRHALFLEKRNMHASVKRVKRYNLTEEEYVAMFERQEGVCAICKKPETSRNQKGTIRSLAIDHDHNTGKVRGLLCFRCNTNLGVIESEQAADFHSYLSKAE